MIRVVTEENRKKYEMYKIMLGNLNRSIDKGYYLQAVFIEYAMLEDRANSIIRVLMGKQVLDALKERNAGLDKKICKIKNFVNNNSNDAWIKKFLNNNLLDSIIAWKDERNKIVHALMEQFSSQDSLQGIAEEGKNLAREFKDVANKVKNHEMKVAKRKATKKK